MKENELETIEWSALEYEEKERSPDWFWALGIIVIAGSITSIIYGNYFFAMLLIIGGLLSGYFAIKKPDMVQYKLTKNGFQIKNRLLTYDTIRSFCVQQYTQDKKQIKPILFINSGRQFMPLLSIPISEEMIEIVKEMMLYHGVKEEEIHEPPATKLMETLGF